MVLCFWVTALASAQDAVKVDPQHYKVEFENARVRVLRAHYGPHEKSVMHSHPAAVVVYLSDGTIRFTLPGGKTREATAKNGQVLYTPAETHNPENTGNTPFEVIVVELKGGAAKSAAKSMASK
jgi:quercetin dioxygenase-like cupin family protein